MSEPFDLVIVGMGSAGLIAAEFAAGLDLRVAVVESHRFGGDSLWSGCVPSKTLIASAKVAHAIRRADRYGIRVEEPTIDLQAVWRRLRHVRAEIASTDDDPSRYRDLGIEIVRGRGRVTGPNQVTVDGTHVLDGRFVLLCTGSRPVEPAIPGLADAGYLTTEQLFEIDAPPTSIIMIGGGPTGVELAQAFVRLGIATSLIEQGPSILPRDEPSLVAILSDLLRREGVDLHTEAQITGVRTDGDERVVTVMTPNGAIERRAAGLLVAVGRRPNADGLGLEELGIDVGPTGVVVDDRGRTSVRTVYAVGDLAGRHLFTHAAGHEAVRAVRDMFFPGKGGIAETVPWCTFTDPELAHAGATIAEAEARYGTDTDVWRVDLSHNDRARADGATEGAIIIVTAKERIVGAHALAPAAGEMIQELALAIRNGMRLGDIAGLVHVYPTISTSIGMLATESAFERAHRLRWLVKRR